MKFSNDCKYCSTPLLKLWPVCIGKLPCRRSDIQCCCWRRGPYERGKWTCHREYSTPSPDHYPVFIFHTPGNNRKPSVKLPQLWYWQLPQRWFIYRPSSKIGIRIWSESSSSSCIARLNAGWGVRWEDWSTDHQNVVLQRLPTVHLLGLGCKKQIFEQQWLLQQWAERHGDDLSRTQTSVTHIE